MNPADEAEPLLVLLPEHSGPSETASPRLKKERKRERENQINRSGVWRGINTTDLRTTGFHGSLDLSTARGSLSAHRDTAQSDVFTGSRGTSDSLGAVGEAGMTLLLWISVW